MTAGSLPLDDNGKPVLGLWNDAAGTVLPLHVAKTVTGSDGKTYAVLDVDVTATATVASDGATGAAVPADASYLGYNSGGNLIGVSSANPLPVSAQHASMIDATNSSTTLLTSGSTFTGTAQSSLPYSALSVEAFADQVSAAGGLQIQQSQDGTHWDTVDSFTVSASTNFQTTVNLIGSKYRVVYTNGGTNQGAFRLQTVAQTQDVVLPRTLTANGDLKVAGDYTEMASLSAGSLNADLVPSTDVSAYKMLSLHVNTNAYSGTLSFQCSNDNANWQAVFASQPGFSNLVTSTSATNVVFFIPVLFRYFRCRMTSYSSGTAQGTLELYTTPAPLSNSQVQVQNFPGNSDNISLVASGAYTTTQTSSDQTASQARGVIVVLDMTNVTASPSVTLEIDGKDPVSGKYFSLLTGAAVTTVSTNVYTVYPGAPATANVSANSPLTKTWRVRVTANNANSGTYSVGAITVL